MRGIEESTSQFQHLRGDFSSHNGKGFRDRDWMRHLSGTSQGQFGYLSIYVYVYVYTNKSGTHIFYEFRW